MLFLLHQEDAEPPLTARFLEKLATIGVDVAGSIWLYLIYLPESKSHQIGNTYPIRELFFPIPARHFGLDEALQTTKVRQFRDEHLGNRQLLVSWHHG